MCYDFKFFVISLMFFLPGVNLSACKNSKSIPRCSESFAPNNKSVFKDSLSIWRYFLSVQRRNDLFCLQSLELSKDGINSIFVNGNLNFIAPSTEPYVANKLSYIFRGSNGPKKVTIDKLPRNKVRITVYWQNGTNFRWDLREDLARI